MKKVWIAALSALSLAACSSPTALPQAQAPLDMKTVEAYNAKVFSGNTVAAYQKKAPAEADTPLNASDNAPKQAAAPVYGRPRVVIAPSIGYGYYRHRHW